jgi:Tol biopolymer transport system component
MHAHIWCPVLLVLGVALGVSGLAAADAPSLDAPGTYVIEVESGRAILLGRGALVAWSPDGRTVAVAEIGAESAMPRLRLVSVPDGEMRKVPISEQGEINHLRWSPDGSRLAFTLTRADHDPGPSLLVVDPASGAIRQLARGSIGELTWTPDSSGITAITLDEGGGSIVTFEAATGEVRETVPDARDASCQRGIAWSPDGAYLAYGGPGLREGCGDVGNWGIWTWQPALRASRQLFSGAADVPQWLANGEVVAMVSEPDAEGIPPLSIVRLSPDGGPPRPIVQDIPRMFPQPPRLLQVVGSTVLFPVSTCDEGAARVWSPGRVESTRQTPEGVYAYRPALSPDGRSLAYVRVGDRAELVVAPFSGGDDRVLATTPLGLQVGTAGPWDAGGDWSPDGRWIAVEVTTEQFRDCVS